MKGEEENATWYSLVSKKLSHGNISWKNFYRLIKSADQVRVTTFLTNRENLSKYESELFNSYLKFRREWNINLYLEYRTIVWVIMQNLKSIREQNFSKKQSLLSYRCTLLPHWKCPRCVFTSAQNVTNIYSKNRNSAQNSMIAKVCE